MNSLLKGLMFFLFSLNINAQVHGVPENSSERYSFIKINSIPEVSTVFMDSIIIGTTPLLINVKDGADLNIQIIKPGYFPFNCMINPKSADTVMILAPLQRYIGWLSVYANNSNSQIRINNVQSNSLVDRIPLELGIHDISIYDSSTRREIETSIRINPLEHIALKAKYSIVSGSHLFNSYLFPGYSQIRDNHYFKGFSFAFVGIGTTTNLIYQIINNNKIEQEYKNALLNYDKSITELEAEQSRTIAERKKEEYRITKNNLWISVGLVSTTWLLNALDVSLNHFFIDRIEVSTVKDDVSPRRYRTQTYKMNFKINL